MKVVHDKVVDLDQILIKFVLMAKHVIFLKFFTSNIKQFLEELLQTIVVEVVLLEEFVAHGCLAQFHDKVVDSLHTVSDLAGVVARHLMRLHLLTVGLPKLGGQLFILLF